MISGEGSKCTVNLDSPSNWIFKAQGNANVVYEYQGSLPYLTGKVLRIRKSAASCCWVDAKLEAAVWASLGSDHHPPLVREIRYTREFLLPLIGSEYIPDVEYVELSPAFTEALGSFFPSCQSNLSGSAALLPDCTRLTTLIPTTACNKPGSVSLDAAHLEMNESNYPSVDSFDGRQNKVLCVEIKPKCGFLLRCNTVCHENRMKHSRSRYQLHQLLKVSEGKAAQPSLYDPLDLFSKDPDRMLNALRSLLADPQNNLKLFLSGRPVGVREGLQGWLTGTEDGTVPACHGAWYREHASFGNGDCRGIKDGCCKGHKPAFHKARCPSNHPSVSHKQAPESSRNQLSANEAEEELTILLQHILDVENILSGILAAQQQCQYDIEGVYTLYCKLRDSVAAEASCNEHHKAGTIVHEAVLKKTSQVVCTEAQDMHTPLHSCHRQALQQLLELPRSEAYEILRRYVISATAKDCAIMIAMQPLPAGLCSLEELEAEQPSVKVVQHPLSGALYQYDVVVVDLDMKPLAKIPQHYLLDKRILHAAKMHVQPKD